VIVPVLGLAGAAYLIVGLVRGGRFPLEDVRLVFLAVGFVVAAVLIFFMSLGRIEIDAEEIRQYRGAKLLRRAPVRTIRGIALGLQKKILRFDGGEEFTLHDGFENAKVAVAFFQAILDARASAAAAGPARAGLAAAALAPPAVDLKDAGGALPVGAPVGTRVTLPLQYVVFPAKCCRCGRAAGTTCQVSLSRSIWLLFTTVSTTATVTVPVCKWCKTKRSVAGILSLLFLLLAIVAGIIAIFALGVSRGGPAITLAALGVFGVVMWVLGRSMDGLLDGRFVGVRAVSMSKNVQTITLRFRDAGMAATVAALTERRRAAQVAGAKQMLGEA
jgi:hypothetical protein